MDHVSMTELVRYELGHAQVIHRQTIQSSAEVDPNEDKRDAY